MMVYIWTVIIIVLALNALHKYGDATTILIIDCMLIPLCIILVLAGLFE